MEEKSLKFAAVFLSAITVLMCMSLPLFPEMRARVVDAREKRAAEQENEDQQVAMQNLEILDEEDTKTVEKGQLRLRLPEGVDGGEVSVINDYVTQKILIEIPGTDSAYFDSYPIVGSSNHIDTVSYAMEEETGVLEIVMDRVYELDMKYDARYYYFDFLTPQEVYDKVVVIDAGHGGKAPGATKQGVNEKDIDLAIALELREIFAESGRNIGVYYTRIDDSNPTFEQRVQLANKSGANLFISIHNNSLGNGRMSETNGTQVMYDEESEESYRLAQICLDKVTAEIGSNDKGLVEGDSIYIIRNSEVPVALIEVGFMTNQRELELLQTQEYQKKTAEGIYQAILAAFEEGY